MKIDVRNLSVKDVEALVDLAQSVKKEFGTVYRRRPYNLRLWERYLMDKANEVITQCESSQPKPELPKPKPAMPISDHRENYGFAR